VGGDIAYSHSFNRIAGTKQDGSEPNVWFRDTLCFRKIDDQWRIAHAHESVPFYMDEPFLAALDLKP
ncbi:MAG: nuclear transport factor 2 family protein, partial [Verrucomicrobiales bacterium]|nr:nuclear transport factor 2 family protein [Verrucomicrobiales bacterium]